MFSFLTHYTVFPIKNNKARMKQKVTVFITAFCLSLCSIKAYSQTDLSSLINYALVTREIKKASLQEQEASYMRKSFADMDRLKLKDRLVTAKWYYPVRI